MITNLAVKTQVTIFACHVKCLFWSQQEALEPTTQCTIDQQAQMFTGPINGHQEGHPPAPMQ